MSNSQSVMFSTNPSPPEWLDKNIPLKNDTNIVTSSNQIINDLQNTINGYSDMKLNTEPEINPTQMLNMMNNPNDTNPNKASSSKYSDGGNFNSALFNKDFDKIIGLQDELAEIIENKKLIEINSYSANKQNQYRLNNIDISNKTLNEILIEWFHTLNSLLDDLININIFKTKTPDTINSTKENINDKIIMKTLSEYQKNVIKNNKLFYIGLTLLFIGIIGSLLQNISKYISN